MSGLFEMPSSNINGVVLLFCVSKFSSSAEYICLNLTYICMSIHYAVILCVIVLPRASLGKRRFVNMHVRLPRGDWIKNCVCVSLSVCGNLHHI
jgi:hypothetical protein